MIYLYCIIGDIDGIDTVDAVGADGLQTAGLTRACALRNATGLSGAPVFVVPHSEIAAMVSLTDQHKIDPAPESVWQHEQLVEALMARHTVLPARFGTIMPDYAALEAELAGRYAGFAADIDRLRGRVEVSVRVMWDENVETTPAAAGPAGGRAYLLMRFEEEKRKQQHRAKAQALAGELHAILAEDTAGNVFRVMATPRLVLTAAYLIERDRLPEFQCRVNRLAARHPELRIASTGPWPAYNFVTAGMAPKTGLASLLQEMMSDVD